MMATVTIIRHTEISYLQERVKTNFMTQIIFPKETITLYTLKENKHPTPVFHVPDQ